MISFASHVFFFVASLCSALPSHESSLSAYFRSCRSAFSSFWLIHVVVGHLISCDKYAPLAFSLTLKRFAEHDDDVCEFDLTARCPDTALPFVYTLV